MRVGLYSQYRLIYLDYGFLFHTIDHIRRLMSIFILMGGLNGGGLVVVVFASTFTLRGLTGLWTGFEGEEHPKSCLNLRAVLVLFYGFFGGSRKRSKNL